MQLRKVNKLGLTQVRLYFEKDDNNNRKADYMKFESADSSDHEPPTLWITYSVP